MYNDIVSDNNFNVDTVKYLLEKGADITAKTGWGDTVAHYAALSGCAMVLEYLVELGCPVGKENGKIVE